MQDINPIKPIIQVSVFTQTQLLVFWGVVALFLGIFFVYSWWRLHNYYVAKHAHRKIKNYNLHDYRLETLKALDQVRQKIETQEFKTYYLEITKIIKNYLSYRYETILIKLTTKETLQKCKFSTTMKDLVHLFLQKVDQAKFANENLKVPSAETVYEVANKIINCTK